MRSGKRYPVSPVLAGTPDAAATRHLGGPVGQGDHGMHPPPRRWWAAAAWAGGGLALFAFFLRISLGSRVDSDGANNALQAWDMLHGHVLLHGWLIGDATFYFFELPLNAITELLFGLGNLATHVASALTYLIVAVFAVALAVTDSRGPARAARCAVVVTVLAAPLFTKSSVALLLEEPDHIGTSAFLLASFLLIDRAPGRRFTAPLLCVILCAGQLSDLTVRYVAVPAVLVVCGYRVLAARRLRSGDTALVVAAAASVPLESLIRAAMLHLGAFSMVPPRARLVADAAMAASRRHDLAGHPHPVRGGRRAGHQARQRGSRFRAGLPAGRRVRRGAGGMDLARREPGRAAAMRRHRLNVGAYLVSVMPLPKAGAHEIAAVLPCGAVLAARACVPAADYRDAASWPGGHRDGARRVGAAGRRGHPAPVETGYGTPRCVARGARTQIRHRRVLGCLGCHHAVGPEGGDPRG